jgi:DNA-binding response OmpR family regulator
MLVEDDQSLLEATKYNLLKEGYGVITASDGSQAIALARKETPDLIILDIMLPELDGFEVCRILRKEMTTPILMLTAKSDEVDKIVGLEIGADDYLTKPFSIRELLARIKALLRRSSISNIGVTRQHTENPVLTAGDIELNPAAHKVSRKGILIELNPKEFDMLAFFMRNRGHVFTRSHILQTIWVMNI